METTRRTFLGSLAAASVPVTIVVAPVEDQKQKALVALSLVEQFLYEETGVRWMIYASGGRPGMILAVDNNDQSLHDPMGLFGKKLRHGKPSALA